MSEMTPSRRLAYTIAGFLLLVALGASLGRSITVLMIKGQCDKDKTFIIDNQVYRCEPTGQWSP